MQLDDIDCQILDALQKEGRLKNRALAERVRLSESACLERVKCLENNGVITGYRAIVDYAAMGYPLEFWGEITLTDPGPEAAVRFSNLLHRTPAIASAYRLAGRHDFLVRAVAPSMACWDSLLRSAEAEGVGIAAAKTSVVIGRVKDDASIALNRPALRLVERAI